MTAMNIDTARLLGQLSAILLFVVFAAVVLALTWRIVDWIAP